MKNVLLIACALGFGFFPAFWDLRPATVWIILAAILLGLIYFVLWRHDWPPRLIPWLFACAAIGRVAAYWWLNSRRGRSGSLIDQDVWVFGGLAAFSLVYSLYKWMKNQSEIPNPANPEST